MLIPFTDLHIDEEMNCRGKISRSSLKELAEDIGRNGLYQPILVSSKMSFDACKENYIVVGGFRRAITCRDLLKHKEIECNVRELNQEQRIIANAGENLKRSDLNLLQEAQPIKRLMMMGYDRKRIAHVLGKSTGWVQPRMYLLTLSPAIQKAAEAGFLTSENIRDLYSIKDVGEQLAIVKHIKEKRKRGYVGAIKIDTATVETKKSRAKIARHRDLAEITNMQEFLAHIEFPMGIGLKQGCQICAIICVARERMYCDLLRY